MKEQQTVHGKINWYMRALQTSAYPINVSHYHWSHTAVIRKCQYFRNNRKAAFWSTLSVHLESAAKNGKRLYNGVSSLNFVELVFCFICHFKWHLEPLISCSGISFPWTQRNSTTCLLLEATFVRGHTLPTLTLLILLNF